VSIALTVTRVTIGSPRDCTKCGAEMRYGTAAFRETNENGESTYRHVQCPREDEQPEEVRP
jgi:hypothetical protein